MRKCAAFREALHECAGVESFFMWIMVAGPYTSGARSEEQKAENLRVLNRAAVEIFRMGHVPVIGVNMALPMIEAAGEAAFGEIMIPVSLALTERCDACLRIGGPSKGADDEAERFRAAGKPVFYSFEEQKSAVPEAPSPDLVGLLKERLEEARTSPEPGISWEEMKARLTPC